VAVLRRLQLLQQEDATGMRLLRRVDQRVPPGLQEVREDHRQRRQARLPVQGRHHQLLPAPLHARRGTGHLNECRQSC
jgi:hypothetical protein